MRFIGNIHLDSQRNYSETLHLAHVGTFNGIFRGHSGITESARLLSSRLPTTQFPIAGTVIEQSSRTRGWATERWDYHNPHSNIQVTDEAVLSDSWFSSKHWTKCTSCDSGSFFSCLKKISSLCLLTKVLCNLTNRQGLSSSLSL